MQKRLLALVATVAMVLSMFTGIAFATSSATDATASIDFKSGASKAAGASSVLAVTVTATNPTTPIKAVVIDLGSTGFAIRGQGASVWNSVAGTVGTVSANSITFTNATGLDLAKVATFEIPVINPATVATVASGITVKVDDDTTDANPAVALTTVTYSLKTEYKVEVTPASVTHNGVSKVVGKVTGLAPSTASLNWSLKDASAIVVAAGVTTDGTITVQQTFVNKADHLTSNYTLEVTDGTYTGSKTIAVKYNAVVDDFGAVGYNDTKTFQGKVTDGAANPAGLSARILLVPDGWTTGDLVATTKGWTTTGADGSFILTHKFTDSGDYNLVAWKDFNGDGAVDAGEAYTIKSFTVAARTMDVTVTGSAVANTAVDSVLTFAAKVGDVVHTTDTTFTVKDPSGNVVGTHTGATATFKFSVAGVYTVEAVKAAGGTNSYKGSTTFVVAAPGKVNVAVTAPTGDIYPNGSVNITLTFVDKTGDGRVAGTTNAAQIKEVKYTVTGPIAASKTFDTTVSGNTMSPDNKDATVNVNIQQGGTLTIEGLVTMGDGATVPFTKTLTVKGYLATFSKTLGTVGDVVTLNTVVTTQDGTPVNNATVTYTLTDAWLVKDSSGNWVAPTLAWGSATALTVGPNATNINNGTYTKEVKLNKAGTVLVDVRTTGAANPGAQWSAAIDGSSVYTVTSPSTLIVTNSGDLVINVKDAAGNNVTSLTGLTVAGGGISKNLNDASIVDTNNDGQFDSYKFAGIKATKAGDVVVTASTDNGAKIGKLTVKAVAPQVIFDPADKLLTENVKEAVAVELTDVYSNIELQGILKITGVGATLDGIFLGNSTTSETITSNAYTFASGRSFTFKALAFDVVEATPVAPQLKLEASYDNGATFVEVGRIDIKPLVVTVSPEKMTVGSLNRVDINVKDAHGAAYVDKAVELMGSDGTTDEDGNVTMFITVNSTGTARINVGTSRSGVYAVKRVPVVYTPPTEPVKTVLKGEQVKRQGEFVFVQLRQFEELGASVGWKQDTQTATFIVGDTKVEVTIGSLTAKVNGKAVTMPAAPFIDKATSRTYVPTRFIAEALNWNVHWAQGDVVTITLP